MTLPERHPTVLLIDDQPIIGETVRQMLAAAPEIELHVCTTPATALATAARVKPTVILQDLVMPGVDGLMLVKFFRASAATRDVPLVVLSSREEPLTKAAAFARGASDYLVKLPDPVELIARIRHHSAGYCALLERNLAYEALAATQAELAEEIARAGRYARVLLPEPLDGKVRTRWSYVPCAGLGGDAFNYHWIDDDRLIVYLLDVCGHGVGAALLGVSVMNVLRSQALRGPGEVRPEEVLASLNRSFPMTQHDGMYFTMWCGVLDLARGRLSFSDGAHPAALLCRADGSVEDLSVGGTMIGIAPDATFERREVAISPGERLYLFSDGAYEIILPDGSLWSYDDFRATLTAAVPSAQSPVESLVERCRELRGGQPFDDDVSLLEVLW
jgi:sigma-B regulation protein RsbU (phosphoserine phosphatase)